MVLYRSENPGDLPQPSADALAHSSRLAEKIRAEINYAGGRISFSRFMELALYAPGLGYYSAGARKFGEAGDYTTAPEMAPLFSRCVGQVCAELFEHLGAGDILELGAGSGAMAADLLRTLAHLPRLPGAYRILEVSADLRERQRETLANRIPEMLDRVEWLTSLPRQPFDGIIVGNEVLDALPVERFRRTGEGIESLGVGAGENGFCWETGPAEPEVAAAVHALEQDLGYRLPDGYESEVCIRLGPLLASLADCLRRGYLLFFDYGLPRAAYYHPERSAGTLMCHYRHRAHDNPFLWPGLQDITAWVDFTAVAEAARAAGFELEGYSTQAHFLLGAGLDSIIQRAAADHPETLTKLAREAKLLTLPEEMGERFKAIALSKGIQHQPPAFTVRDLSPTL